MWLVVVSLTCLLKVEERKTRSMNVILYNVPESTSTLGETRIRDDRASVSDAIKDIDSNVDLDKAKIYRLGVPIANRIRPIKLEFDDPIPVRSILTGKSKLRNGIKANNDLTNLQRSYLSDLRKELDERRRKGENSITIKYINSVPKIVNSRPKNSVK